jgi:hypothetical protein
VLLSERYHGENVPAYVLQGMKDAVLFINSKRLMPELLGYSYNKISRS